MNLHIIQSRGARAEVSTIMRTANHIVSRQNSSALMGNVQNSLIAMYIMTNIFLGKDREELVYRYDLFDIMTYAYISLDRYYSLAERAKDLYPKYIKMSGE